MTHENIVKVIKNLLGGGILIWMLYAKIENGVDIEPWMFVFPGLLLELEVSASVSKAIDKLFGRNGK